MLKVIFSKIILENENLEGGKSKFKRNKTGSSSKQEPIYLKKLLFDLNFDPNKNLEYESVKFCSSVQ